MVPAEPEKSPQIASEPAPKPVAPSEPVADAQPVENEDASCHHGFYMRCLVWLMLIIGVVYFLYRKLFGNKKTMTMKMQEKLSLKKRPLPSLKKKRRWSLLRYLILQWMKLKWKRSRKM